MCIPLRYIVRIDPDTLKYGYTVQFIDTHGNALPCVHGFNLNSAGEADKEAQRVMRNIKHKLAA